MLTESSSVDQITVTENGIVQVRVATTILRDGTEIAKTYLRTTLTPGQDVSDQPSNVQTICFAAWTSDVIAAYQSQMAAQEAARA